MATVETTDVFNDIWSDDRHAALENRASGIRLSTKNSNVSVSLPVGKPTQVVIDNTASKVLRILSHNPTSKGEVSVKRNNKRVAILKAGEDYIDSVATKGTVYEIEARADGEASVLVQLDINPAIELDGAVLVLAGTRRIFNINPQKPGRLIVDSTTTGVAVFTNLRQEGNAFTEIAINKLDKGIKTVRNGQSVRDTSVRARTTYELTCRSPDGNPVPLLVRIDPR